jgi:DNA processing protein
MTGDLSPNTQAILLLTAPLIVGQASHAEAPLTTREYNQLALHLRDTQHQPADLLTHGADDVLKECRSIVDDSRVRRLLERGFLLSQAVERWHSRAIWVMSRADAGYPRRLKHRLKEVAPPVLYGCGDAELLGTGGLAVVGSRHVDEALLAYAEAIGRLAAAARQTVVSGGARGIDQAAMRGALDGPGKVAGVLADSLEQAALGREHRTALMDRRLVLISPYDPGAPFHVGHAMQRNKLIYALADAALVVNSDLDKGGTWAGATEQLEKLHFVPVYVRATGELGDGLRALQAKGALPWPEPHDASALVAALQGASAARPLPPQDALPFATTVAPAARWGDEAPGPARELFGKARELLLRLLTSPLSEAEVGAALGLHPAQVTQWLERLVAEGVVERSAASGYVVSAHQLADPAPAAVPTGETRA